MFKLKNVSKIYLNGKEDYYALNDIVLNVDKGMIVILGPSGAGKSTLLNVMSGLEKNDLGEICFETEEEIIYMNRLSDKERVLFRRKYVGFIFQSYYLLPNLNVENNIKMGAYLAGNKDFKEITEFLGINHLMKKMPFQLSGGEQQRVSIARALAKRPEVLFCDEPTGALDEKTGKQVLSLISKQQKEYNTTVIMVTHNPGIAEMADNVIKLLNGEIDIVYKNENVISASEVRWA